MRVVGRVHRAARELRATDIVPTSLDGAAMRRDWAKCGQHLLAEVDPGFANTDHQGQIIVVDGPIGDGHAHYHPAAIMGCLAAGVRGIVGTRVSPLFQRAAIDAGLLVWQLPQVPTLVSTGDTVELDLAHGTATNLSTGDRIRTDAVPQLILDILAAGGCEPWARVRVGHTSVKPKEDRTSP